MRPFSQQLRFDIADTVEAAVRDGGVLYISLLAEQIRERNGNENIALEDIEYQVLQHGQMLSAAMSFDRTDPMLED